MAVQKKEHVIDVPELQQEIATFNILGVTPLIMNRMAEKAKRELLKPAGRKTAAQKKTSTKHDPPKEYRDSAYLAPPATVTHLGFPAPAFKRAIAQAAVDIPGATKAAIGRLVRVPGMTIPIYGVPQIFTAVVRSADAAKTPDIRTRAILPRWACQVQVQFVIPILKAGTIANLLSGAGQIVGIGDGRQEKGALDFGLFQLVGDDDAEWLDIVGSGGRAEQEAALKEPDYYDAETEELLGWYQNEIG